MNDEEWEQMVDEEAARDEAEWRSLVDSEPSQNEIDMVDTDPADEDRMILAEAEADAQMARFDDDPNPYHGTGGEW